MMSETILDEAIAWHLAGETATMDWDGFTRWLERDDDHRRQYEAIAQTDAMLIRHHDTLARQAAVRARRRQGGWLAAAFAASAAAAALVLVVTGQGGEQTFATQGQGREVALADGSTITLAPHSRLTLADAQGSRIDLSGGAYFAVRHHPGRTMAIHAGALTVADIGTRFDIQSDGGSTRIAVAEGLVEVRSPELERAVPLSHGRALLFEDSAGQAHISAVGPDDVGSWRKGELSYTEAELGLVALDLARYGGRGLDVPDDMKGRRFSGTLVVGNGHYPAQDLARLMGLALVRGAGRDRLVRASVGR